MGLNIGIIMGGYSEEVNISLKSGEVVFNTLKKTYNCFKLYLLKENWYYVDNYQKKHNIIKETFKIENNLEIEFDCIFNAIHGSPGEDGEIHEYFNNLNIPITGSGIKQSELTFDKIKCIKFLKEKDIKTANSIVINKSTNISLKKIESEIGFPCFIKASKSGSSFGVYKVYNYKEFLKYINYAFKVDDNLLIEAYIEGREFSIGVVTFKNNITVLPITEIITSNDFFDYEAKYKGKSEEITPANINDELKKNLNKISEKIYKLLNLKGLSRSEFIVNKNGIYYLETNTVPGLTDESILPQQAKFAGITLKELFSNSINEVLK